MNIIQFYKAKNWHGPFAAPECLGAIQSLEQGKALYFADLPFRLQGSEHALLSPYCLSLQSKNISFDPLSGAVKGMALDRHLTSNLKAMMQRFSEHALALIEGLLPHYRPQLILGRTSYRPAEISGRATSYRKDDTRLHIDAFPSSPNQGNRILRVFSNINPHGQSRIWRLGEPFEDVAKGFLPWIRKPFPGASALLKALQVTKSKRAPYDHYMLKLHNLMKADLGYQKNVRQLEFQFQAQSSWIVMTDHVSHAAMAGQYALEQTFYLPVSGMKDERLSPLRVLERLTGRNLV